MSHRTVSLIKNGAAPADLRDEATRRLCAAVYHDREVRDLVVNKILVASRHRVAPSYGFDMVPVADHAWRAWSLEAVQHVCVLAVLIITAVCSPSAAITTLCVLGLIPLARYTAQLAPEVFEAKARACADRYVPAWRKKSKRKDIDRKDWKEETRRLKLSLAGCGFLLAVPAVAAGAEQTPLYLVVLWSSASLVLITVVTATAAVARWRSILVALSSGPPGPARKNRRLREIDRQQTSLIVVYRRPKRKTDPETGHIDPFQPNGEPGFFVGTGTLVHRWLPPLTIQLLRPRRGDSHDRSGSDDLTRREYVEPPFKAHDLVAHLRTKMRPIGHTADPSPLPGYRINHRVYVEEADAPNAFSRLRASGGEENFLRKVINDPDDVCQHFLEVRVTSSGELVTTVFMRVTVKGRCLTLDLATCALTRTPSTISPEYTWARWDRQHLIGHALSSIPEEIARSCLALNIPMYLARYVQACFGRRPVSCKAPRHSLREKMAVSWQEAVIDEPTILDHMKIIEQRMLRATEDFLRAHDVDTSAFERRAETIVNANVLNMGDMNINNSAVGPDAQVNQNSAPQPSAQGAQR